MTGTLEFDQRRLISTVEMLLERIKQLEEKVEPTQKMLDGYEVMKIFQISERTLASWRKESKIEFIKIGKTVRYTQAGINKVINQFKN